MVPASAPPLSSEKMAATSFTGAANFAAIGSISMPNWVANPAITKFAKKLMAVSESLFFIVIIPY